MLKRLLILSLTLLAVIGASGAIATGWWKAFPISGEFTQIVDTGSKVWYVSGGQLGCFDPQSDETTSYSYGKQLSGHNITKIFHNPAKNMLFVAYTDGGIDVIDANGEVTALPDIKDASITATKDINDMAFHGDDIYVATAFGLVVFDATDLSVKESGIYNGHGILSLGASDEGLLLSPTGYASGKAPLLWAPQGRSLRRYENFDVIQRSEGTTYTSIMHLSGLQWAGIGYKKAAIIKLKEDYSFVWRNNAYNGCNVSGDLMPAPDGGFYFYSVDNKLRYVNTSGELSATVTTLPDDIKGNVIGTVNGPSRIWAGATDGLGGYAIADDGSVTVTRQKSLDPSATTFSEIAYIFPTADGRGFFVMNQGQTQSRPTGTSDNFSKPMRLNRYDDGTFTNIQPDNVADFPPVTSMATTHTKNVGPYIFSPTAVAEDPDHPGRYFIGTGVEGVYVVENNKVIAKFDDTNSPIYKIWGVSVNSLTIDKSGNLWVGVFSDNNRNCAVLPAAKRRQANLSTLTKDDWIDMPFGEIISQKDHQILVCEKSNMAFSIDYRPATAMVALSHNGDPTDASGRQVMEWNKLTDSDGLAFEPQNYWSCIVEDKRGQVWIGTSQGIVTIPDPTTAMSTSLRVNRLKVPRRDGTNLADYLLESEGVLCIAVDNSNRKWIGTDGSGLYLVSENGDEIIARYTSANSLLGSDIITSVYPDPYSNSVFVGTLGGLYELASTSSPAMPDYSEAYAYPNPVTPDYTGWVTITGLMDSSMVKIVDAGMHLVYQTTSEGGQAMWDLCNMAGHRVATGVYYVLASSGNDTTSEGAMATKILVVN